jgi:hypothetical protein
MAYMPRESPRCPSDIRWVWFVELMTRCSGARIHGPQFEWHVHPLGYVDVTTRKAYVFRRTATNRAYGFRRTAVESKGLGAFMVAFHPCRYRSWECYGVVDTINLTDVRSQLSPSLKWLLFEIDALVTERRKRKKMEKRRLSFSGSGTSTGAHLHAGVHARTHAHARIRTGACTLAQTHTYTRKQTYADTHARTHTHTHTHTCIHAHARAHTDAHAHAHAHPHAHAHAHARACAHAHTHTPTPTHTHTHTHHMCAGGHANPSTQCHVCHTLHRWGSSNMCSTWPKRPVSCYAYTYVTPEFVWTGQHLEHQTCQDIGMGPQALHQKRSATHINKDKGSSS